MTDEEIAREMRDRFVRTQPRGTATFDQLPPEAQAALTSRVREFREIAELLGVPLTPRAKTKPERPAGARHR